MVEETANKAKHGGGRRQKSRDGDLDESPEWPKRQRRLAWTVYYIIVLNLLTQLWYQQQLFSLIVYSC